MAARTSGCLLHEGVARCSPVGMENGASLMRSSRTGVGKRPVTALLAVAALVTASVAILFSSVASGSTFTVTNSNDSGAGSLRQEVIDAAANGGDDEVVVTPGLGPINLASEIDYDGAAAGAVTIRGNGVTVTAGAFQA